MRIDQKPFSRTETEKGKAGRIKILQGILPAELTRHRLAVECWKKMKIAEKVSASASRKENREGDTLCIAPKALPNFQRATRIAIGKIVFRITESVPETIGWYSASVKMQRCLTIRSTGPFAAVQFWASKA